MYDKESTYCTVWRGCISMEGKGRLIECAKNVNGMCVCL